MEPKKLIEKWVEVFNEGLRGCGFFQIPDGKIKFQRGCSDNLSFLRQHKLPIPTV